MAALIDKCGNNKHYSLEMYQNGISKETRSSVIGMTDNGIPSSSSDSATTIKLKNNCRDMFKFQTKNNVYLSKHRMMHCLGIGKKPLHCTEDIKFHA